MVDQKAHQDLIRLIEQSLIDEFQPESIEIRDDTAKHLNHKTHKDKPGLHLFITIESLAFNNYTLLENHKLIYRCLDQFIKNAMIHALSLSLKKADRKIST